MNEYLETMIIGCAWCNKVIRVNTVIVEENNKFIVVSHSICEKCKRKIFLENKIEEESEEFSNI